MHRSEKLSHPERRRMPKGPQIEEGKDDDDKIMKRCICPIYPGISSAVMSSQMPTEPFGQSC